MRPESAIGIAMCAGLLGLAALFAFSAPAQSSRAVTQPVTPEPMPQHVRPYVLEMRLADGTRCVAIYVDGHTRGISCDWRK